MFNKLNDKYLFKPLCLKGEKDFVVEDYCN
jgi:hypothetical protein